MRAFMEATNLTLHTLSSGLDSIRRKFTRQIGPPDVMDDGAGPSQIIPRSRNAANQALPGLSAVIEEFKTRPPVLKSIRDRDRPS